MKRNLKTEGIILKNYRVADIHKGSVIYLPSGSILYGIAYGGYKGRSRLGSSVCAVSKGNFLLYSDPVRKSTRIVEYIQSSNYDFVKRNLKKYYTALLWFELIMKSHGGGEGGESFYRLLAESLEILDFADEKYDDRLMVQFLIRAVIIFGGSFQSCTCGLCGGAIDKSGRTYYSIRENCYSCISCSSSDLSMYELAPGLIKYSDYSLNNTISDSIKAGIDFNMLKYYRSILYSIIQDYLECSLTVLHSGREFLV